MRRKWAIYLLGALLAVLTLCGCQKNAAEPEMVNYYLVPHGFVLTDYQIEEKPLLAMADKMTCPIGENTLAIISGYCYDGRFVFDLRDTSLIDTANLEFMGRSFDGIIDDGEVVFIDSAFAKEGYTDEALTEQPMRLTINGQYETTLTMANVQPVNDLAALDQVITQDGVSVLCVLDEDGKGAVLTAICDADGGRRTWTRAQKVTAVDQTGQAHDLALSGEFEQYIAFPEAFQGQAAALVVDDVSIFYDQTAAETQQVLIAELTKEQTTNDKNKQMIGPYEAVVRYCSQYDENIVLDLAVEQDEARHLESFDVETTDGRFSFSGDSERKHFQLKVSQENLEDAKLRLPIMSYTVLQKGQWIIDI